MVSEEFKVKLSTWVKPKKTPPSFGDSGVLNFCDSRRTRTPTQGTGIPSSILLNYGAFSF